MKKGDKMGHVCIVLILIGLVGTLYEKNPGLTVFVGIVLVVAFIAMMKKTTAEIKKTTRKINQKKKMFLKNREPLNSAGINVGKYLTGLPTVTEPVQMFCFVTAKDFLFIRNAFEEVGKIPRDAINNILVDDKSQITQRLTATRLLTLGVFSLAVPKKKKIEEYCLLIDWDDENGNRSNTIFEFSGQNSLQLSNVALNELKKHILPKMITMASTEKKCPYCAEIIKKEAKVCRFCNREV